MKIKPLLLCIGLRAGLVISPMRCWLRSMMNLGFNHGDNFGGRNPEGMGERQQRFQRWLPKAAFQHRDIGAIQPSIECNRLLSFARTCTEFPKNLAKYLFDCRPLFHAGEHAYSVCFSLRTIVYISGILCVLKPFINWGEYVEKDDGDCFRNDS